MDHTQARQRPMAPLVLLQAIALAFILLKIVALGSTGIFQDEAYYWLWGQHPALSYYDHPPFNAWLLSLSSAVLGWNKFALRFWVALAFVADIALIWLISRRVAREWPEHFWLTLVLFLATPLFFAATGVALPDHLLITFILAALYFFLTFFESWPQAPRWSALHLGAGCLGLAALAKFNAAFFGIGLALYVVLTPRLRPLLNKPQIYLAVFIALAPQLPVLLWNLQQNMESYGFLFGARYRKLRPDIDGVVHWLTGLLLVIGPFLVAPLFAFGVRSLKGAGLARIVFWLSTLTIVTLAVFTETLFHWNIVAYVVALPFLAFQLRRRWLFWLHIGYCAVMVPAMLINFSWMPLGDVKSRDDPATAWAYGWEETASAVRAAQAEYGTDFVASTEYATAALLAFALEDKYVTSLNPRREQFEYWFDEVAHAGQDAIIVGDLWQPLDEAVSSRFTEIKLLADLPVVRGGQEIDRHQIYLGKGFIAQK